MVHGEGGGGGTSISPVILELVPKDCFHVAGDTCDPSPSLELTYHSSPSTPTLPPESGVETGLLFSPFGVGRVRDRNKSCV